jgi:hypothetical protein
MLIHHNISCLVLYTYLLFVLTWNMFGSFFFLCFYGLQWSSNCVSRKLSKFPFPNCQNFPFQTVKISFCKLSKFPFPNCQNFLFQAVKISLSKLSKFPFANCQNFPFQTVKISLFKLSKFPFANCQNFLLQTVKISLSKLSKFPFANCQNFPFQTVKISFSKLSKFPFQTVKISLFKLSKFPFSKCMSQFEKFGEHWMYLDGDLWTTFCFRVVRQFIQIFVKNIHKFWWFYNDKKGGKFWAPSFTDDPSFHIISSISR